MSIKNKVRTGVMFLFAMILVVAGLGLYYLERLAQDSRNILKDNYESMVFTKRIIEQCDSIEQDTTLAQQRMEANVQAQENNVTEAGEGHLSSQLRMVFETARVEGFTEENVRKIRSICLDIQELNMNAIIRKNEQTSGTAKRASTYLVIAGSLCILAAFTFIVNFPGYIADPIVRLTAGIKAIANKEYEERLQFGRKDEFEELAEAFNLMAEKLDEYEHSNLAKILFEKKRIETIINRMSDPVIGLDGSNKVIFVNDPATELLNLTRESLVGKYAPDIAVNNDLLRTLIQKEKNGSAAILKVVVNKKENYFTHERTQVSYVPTGEKENILIGTVIMLKNITPYKELDLAKTNFIATVSHELKTPIASLQMCVKLLKDQRVGALNDEQANISRTLEDEVTRLSKLTNELLDLSQVETGNIKLSIARTDAGTLVNRAVEAVKFQAERKNIRLAQELDSELPLIQADEDKTTWVLVNLLTNAIRHSPQNGEILLRCRSENGHVRFTVEDKGPGIEARYLDGIFEKFYQVPGTPTGTGLGLAISKEFIEAQGGTIEVKSEVGSGSTFSFNIPHYRQR